MRKVNAVASEEVWKKIGTLWVVVFLVVLTLVSGVCSMSQCVGTENKWWRRW